MTRPILAALLLTLAAPGFAADIEFDAPRAGWRNSQGDSARYTQDVHYPASSVNTPSGQSAAALIQGHIKNFSKSAKPPTLIVNGVSMPLLADASGQFSRPYAFGKGSNGVELRVSGSPPKRAQFYEAYAGKTQARLRIVLAWDTDATDLDLHVITPRGEHVYYGNRVLPGGEALDVDVTTGYGPEIFSAATPVKGSYLVYVNYYGAGEQRDAISVAKIAIITQENTPHEKQQVFHVPLRNPGELTLVKSFVYP